jgi:hypothetical protein
VPRPHRERATAGTVAAAFMLALGSSWLTHERER